MALPKPVLDDRTFEEMVAEALRRAPQSAPAWTDHNRHDPGVTLVELFAWLTEMQRFYLDQVRSESRLAFLALLGVPPRPALPARATVAAAFPDRAADAPPPAPVRLPRGSRLRLGDVRFETAESVTVAPVKLAQIVSSSRAGLLDETAAHAGAGLSFFAFGAEAEAGSRLYLGFDAALPAAELSLDFTLFEDYRDADGDPVARGAHGDEPPEIEPSASLAWEFYGAASAGDPAGQDDWRPLEVREDETRMLALSGRLRCRGPGDARMREIAGSALPRPRDPAAKRFWLRATVVEPGYELPPRLTAVRLGAVPAVEGETLCEVLELDATGEPSLPVPDPSALALTGRHQVQVRQADGLWRDRGRVTVASDGVEIHFAAAPPPAGKGGVRLISCLPAFASRRLLGRGDALPHQVLRLDETPVAELRLQVREGPDGSWRDWERVDDFAASGPGSPHFQLDPASGEIRFGDGREGLPLPAATGDNLRILALRLGGGRRGNVAAGAAVELVADPSPLGSETLTLTLPAAASGGADPESLEDAQVRLRQELRTPWRAVTDPDFETLAKATPGLRVARAWSLPLFSPPLAGYPQSQTPAAVTVVVVPYSESAKPTPNRGFLHTVCRHLDRHRLLTTRLHVVGPDYVRVGVEADLALLPGAGREAVRGRALAALDRFLHPLRGGPAGDGWPFGRPVYVSEIHEVLEHVEGVDCVERVALRAEGEGVTRDARGSVLIPPRSLVCAGDHRLGFVERHDLCRVRCAAPRGAP